MRDWLTPSARGEAYAVPEDRGYHTPCWIWQGSTTGLPNGQAYGQVRHEGRMECVHRVAYEQAHGPVSRDLDIDHLCRQRLCCNPAHLEPVTRAENVRRGDCMQQIQDRAAAQTHCAHGHEYTPENTYVVPSTGRRQCRDCKRTRNLEAYYRRQARKREAVSTPPGGTHGDRG